MSQLVDKLVEMERRIFEVERRAANRKRTGVIDELDLSKGLARVQLEGGETPYRTGWLPWKEIAAGGISSHIPPTKGQQVDVLSESGDLTDAVIDFSTHSNANPRPHDGPEAVIVHGATRLLIGDGVVEISANVTIKGDLQVDGSSMRHNDKSVGADHTHGGVVPGNSNTDFPNP